MIESLKNCSSTIAREPVASDILRMAADLVGRLEMFTDVAECKLGPITTSPCPTPARNEVKEQREYPPLFNELRARFYSFENSLNRLEDILSRVEL